MSPNLFAGAPALATLHDLRRRPALLLSTLAVAVFLWILPDVCARAVEDSSALALQAAVSTITLYLMLVAGFAGLRAGAAEGDLGASAEWRTAPLSATGYLMGRLAGIMGIAVLLLAILVPLFVIGQFTELRADPPSSLTAAFAVAGSLLSAAQLAAIGLLLATLTTPQLATILFLAVIVAGRTVVPELAVRAGDLAALAALFPDPARLDLSRELAFKRPVDAAAMSWALAAGALSTAACLAAASWALRRREV